MRHVAATPHVGSIILAPPTARSRKRAPGSLLTLAVTSVRKRNLPTTTIYNWANGIPARQNEPMLASAARADVGVQCWENEFNSAACTPMLPGRAVLKDRTYGALIRRSSFSGH